MGHRLGTWEWPAWYLHGPVPGVLAPLSEQGNNLRLDMVSFEYQLLRLRALKIVTLPQENIPLFIKALALRAHSTVFVLEAPSAQVFSDSECSTAFSLRKN